MCCLTAKEEHHLPTARLRQADIRYRSSIFVKEQTPQDVCRFVQDGVCKQVSREVAVSILYIRFSFNVLVKYWWDSISQLPGIVCQVQDDLNLLHLGEDSL